MLLTFFFFFISDDTIAFMQVALFGGRFDPIHNGHIAIAREVLKAVPSVDEVWLVPANTHPWRPIAASAEDRLAMLKLVEEPKIKVSDIDIKRGGETFTIDTIRDLQKQTANTYIFICGSDQIKSFDKWKGYKELEMRMPFLVFPRPGSEKEELPPNFMWISDNAFEPMEDSSTRIRELIKAGKSISGLVPESVEKYIIEHDLYK